MKQVARPVVRLIQTGQQAVEQPHMAIAVVRQKYGSKERPKLSLRLHRIRGAKRAVGAFPTARRELRQTGTD